MSHVSSCLLKVHTDTEVKTEQTWELKVAEFKGKEAVSSLYQFDVTVGGDETNYTWSNLEEVLGRPARLELTYQEGGDTKSDQTKYWHGIITNIEELVGSFFKLTLEPKVSKLRWMVCSDVYLDQNLKGLIRQVLKTGKFEDKDWEYSLPAGVNERRTKQLFTCQFEEPCWNFIQRRAEFFGVFYTFDQSDNLDKLVFKENLIVPSESDDFLSATYDPKYEGKASIDAIAITQLTKKASLNPSNIVLKRRASLFNTTEEALASVTQPLKGLGVMSDISSYSTKDQFAIQDSNNTSQTGSEPEANGVISGQDLAVIRAQSIEAKNQQVKATVKTPGLASGKFLRVSKGLSDEENKDFFVLSVHHSLIKGEASGAGWIYEAESILHPCYDQDKDKTGRVEIPYRPAQKTPIPSIDRLVSGFIDGLPYKGENKNSGAPDVIDTSYPTLDEYGRYKVRFDFARARQKSYENNSAWLRMATPYAGGVKSKAFDKQGQPINGDAYETAGGMHFPLRPGTEVLIAFVNGDPDDPVIVSALANEVATSPVTGGQKDADITDNRNQFTLQTPVGNRMTINDFAPEKIGEKWQDSPRSAWQFYTPATNTQLNLGAFYYKADDKQYRGAGFILSTQGKGIINAEDQILLQSNKSVKIVSGDFGDKFDKFIAKSIPAYGSQDKYEEPVIPKASQQPPAMTKEDIDRIIDDKTKMADIAKDKKDNFWKGNSKEGGTDGWLKDFTPSWINYKDMSVAKPTLEPFKLTMGAGSKVDAWIGVKVNFEAGLSAKFSATAGFTLSASADFKVVRSRTKEYKFGHDEKVKKQKAADALEESKIMVDQKILAASRKTSIMKVHNQYGSAFNKFSVVYEIKSTTELNHLKFDALGTSELYGKTTSVEGIQSAKIKAGVSELELSPQSAELKSATNAVSVNSSSVKINSTATMNISTQGRLRVNGNIVMLG